MDKIYIITIVMDIVFTLIFLFAIIYSLLILFIRRFHNHNNVFIVNICFAIMYFTMVYFDYQLLYSPNTCMILFYAYNMGSIVVQFSFLTFSIHRFCSILYLTIPFFKTRMWVVICIRSQWIVQCILSLPFVVRKERVICFLIK
jgi:hypothetical protein